tara:strand:+ start:3265 stop:5049 length:1785 start_codon:yes stop_codon:yes gene_type:complete
MAYTIEVKYFNSIWLKKALKTGETTPSWPGLPWNPTGYPVFPYGSSTFNTAANYNNAGFYLEETKIKGGFNNNTLSYGVRAYVVDENRDKLNRQHSLIFSGLLNSRTGFNQTNVFSISDAIVKDLDPINGSIQKLYTEDTNLNVFQENKVSKILVNKNAMYDGDQGSQDTSSIRFLGQAVAYLGEYGISQNPESFAFYGYRKYFADKNRAAILRLSRDGITEISSYGMKDYFRDYLQTVPNEWTSNEVTKAFHSNPTGTTSTIQVTSADCSDIELGAQFEYIDNTGATITTGSIVTNVTHTAGPPSYCTVTLDIAVTFPAGTHDSAIFVTEVKGKILGAWDAHQSAYTISMQKSPRTTTPSDTTYGDSFATLGFDETARGWTSFYSYKPNQMASLKNKFYTFIDSNIYEHYDDTQINNRCKFYGAATPSECSIEFIFNPNPSVTKNFNTIGYEGSNGWEVDSIKSDFEGFDFFNGATNQYQDVVNPVKSYVEGAYDSANPPLTGAAALTATATQPVFHAGFNRKENKYVANLVSRSVVRPGEVVFWDGDANVANPMSGIKGYLVTAKISTDSTTDVGGMKELFSVSSNFVLSSY